MCFGWLAAVVQFRVRLLQVGRYALPKEEDRLKLIVRYGGKVAGVAGTLLTHEFVAVLQGAGVGIDVPQAGCKYGGEEQVAQQSGLLSKGFLLGFG